MGALILLIFLGMALARRSGGNGDSGDKVAVALWWGPLIWLVCATGVFVVGVNHLLAGIGFALALSVLLVPSLFSWLLARRGWYRASFSVARLAIVYFRRDHFAGAVYRSLQAVERLDDEAQRQAALRWLRQQYLGYSGTIYSGLMVLIVVIEAGINRPGDARYLSGQLRLLDGIAGRSIPKSVGILASKLALAPVLAGGDWREIRAVAEQWNTPAANSIARYLVQYHERHILDSGWVGRFAMYRIRRRVRGYPALYRLPRYLAAGPATVAPPPAESGLASLWRVDFNGGRPTDEAATALRNSINTEARAHWSARAQALGLRDTDAAWRKLCRSVEKTIDGGEGNAELADEDAYARLEHQYKSLNYLAAAIHRRVKSRQRPLGAQEFLDWWRLWQYLHELRGQRNGVNLAVSKLQGMLWDWVADLWDSGNDRCLAHFICRVSEPLALEAGCRELGQMMAGVCGGKYR